MDVGLAETVQQRRLPGVRVPDERHRPLATPLAPPPLHLAGPVELAEVGLEAAHPLCDSHRRSTSSWGSARTTQLQVRPVAEAEHGPRSLGKR